MSDLLQRIKDDPEYKALSVPEQVNVARAALSKTLASDTDFSTMNITDQLNTLNRLSMRMVTFSDPETEKLAKEEMDNYMAGKGTEWSRVTAPFMPTYEGFLPRPGDRAGRAAVKNSGFLTFIDNITQPFLSAEDKTRVNNWKRFMDMQDTYDALQGKSDVGAAIGTLGGMVSDVVGINKIFGGAIKAGRTAVEAQTALTKTAFGTSALKFFAPIIADSIITAVPYYALDEYKRAAAGQPSIASQGAFEIAKTVGENAAVNFFFGSLLTGAFKGVSTTMKKVFGSKQPFTEPLSPAQYNNVEQQFIAGEIAPETFSKFDPYTQARLNQNIRVLDYLKTKDPTNRLARTSLAAQDIGKVIDKTDAGYRIFETDKNGMLRAREYKTLHDVDNYIAYETYKGFSDLTPEELSKALRPDNAPIFERGRLLSNATKVYKSEELQKVAPKTKTKGTQSITGRPVITETEAAALSKLDNVKVFRANFNIEEASVKSNIEAGEPNIFRNYDSLHITPNEGGNALFIGTKEAPIDVYNEATTQAEALSQAMKEPVASIRSSILLNKGYDFATLEDNTVDIFLPRFGRIVAPQVKPVRIPETFIRPKLMQLPNNSAIVSVPELNGTFSFADIAEARSFITQKVKDFDNLGKIATDKNASFSVNDGMYNLTTPAGTRSFTSYDDLKNALAEMPDPVATAKNIMDEVDPNIERTFEMFMKKNKQYQSRKAGPNPYNQPPEYVSTDPEQRRALSAWMNLRKFTSTFTSWAEDVGRRTRDPEFMAHINALKDAMRSAETNTIQGSRLLDSIFRDKNGKYLSKESRQRIFYSMGASTPEAKERLLTIYKEQYGKHLGELTQDEAVAAAKLRGLYNDLGTKFGIQYDKLINNYMPRIRKWIDQNQQKASEMPMGPELVDQVFGAGKVPKEVRFWAEHERVDDLIQYSLKDDAYEVAMQYISQGHKKFYANQRWKELTAYMNNEKFDRNVRDRVNVWREQLMGAFRSLGEKEAENFGRALFRKLGRDPEKGAQLVNAGMSLGYFSSMGFRPFLAIRGSIQPLKTLAPRLGMDWTLDGLDDMGKRGADYYEYLRSIGVIADKPPIVNSVFTHGTVLGRLTENSLAWFKNADDFARAWTYTAATKRLESAIQKRTSGVAKTKAQFFDLSGLDVMEPTIAERIYADVVAGNKAKALSTFGIKWVEDTQFVMKAAESPLMYKGLFGKLFGQFGTFSAGYRANIANMFRYGSIAKKLATISAYVSYAMLIDSALRAARIKTNDFVPFQPMFFSGGPGFDTAIDVLKASDIDLRKFIDSGFTDLGGNYEAAEARKRLLPFLKKEKGETILDLSVLMPNQIRYINKALNYFAQGDSYAGLMSLMSASVNPLSQK